MQKDNESDQAYADRQARDRMRRQEAEELEIAADAERAHRENETIVIDGYEDLGEL